MTERAQITDIGSIEEFMEFAYDKGWTDGLPVFPPTPRLVDEMLRYLGRDPAEVIGAIFPGEGEATIERIAINCVMAGCRPEYAPVVVAAVEALVDPLFPLNPLQSTGGPTLLSVVSGPVVKKLRFNTREWIFGGNGGRPNASIGRAIRLILWNIGQAKPGLLLKGTMGHPAGWSYCIGEEQDLNPWPPFHVDLGLPREASAITLLKAGTHLPMSAAAEIVAVEDTIALLANQLGRLEPVPDYMGGKRNIIMVVNPSYARLLADAGISKQEFKKALADQAFCAAPPINYSTGAFEAQNGRGAEAGPSGAGRLAIIPDVDDLQVVVGGGWGAARSQCAAIAGMSNVGKDLVSKVIRFPNTQREARNVSGL